MTEEPYRWLEAIANRREYVQNQIEGGSPVYALSLDAGILLVGIGPGHSKVFEIFDRHALGGLGHPADLERLRQALIDAAHLEAFARAPEDVTLRRLVSFNLGPQLKTAFEQVFAPPFLVRLLLAEVGPTPDRDVLMKVHFDGTFSVAASGCAVVAADPALEPKLQATLAQRIPRTTAPAEALRLLADLVQENAASANASDGSPTTPPSGPLPCEAALLRRTAARAARYQTLSMETGTPPSAG